MLVNKYDSTLQFCIDYRAVHLLTINNKYPISPHGRPPRRVHGSQFFPKLGLHVGYHQIRMAEDDILKIAFHTFRSL